MIPQENDNEGRRIQNYRSLIGLCPLRSNSAYGFSQAKHSIDLCSNEKRRPIGSYDHLVHIHQLKSVVVQRLIDAIAKKTKSNDEKII